MGDRLLSSLRLILDHLLKWDYQSHKRSRSWQNTIGRERDNIGSDPQVVMFEMLLSNGFKDYFHKSKVCKFLRQSGAETLIVV